MDEVLHDTSMLMDETLNSVCGCQVQMCRSPLLGSDVLLRPDLSGDESRDGCAGYEFSNFLLIGFLTLLCDSSRGWPRRSLRFSSEGLVSLPHDGSLCFQNFGSRSTSRDLSRKVHTRSKKAEASFGRRGYFGKILKARRTWIRCKSNLDTSTVRSMTRLCKALICFKGWNVRYSCRVGLISRVVCGPSNFQTVFMSRFHCTKLPLLN